jgi:hypothetical protein
MVIQLIHDLYKISPFIYVECNKILDICRTECIVYMQIKDVIGLLQWRVSKPCKSSSIRHWQVRTQCSQIVCT